MIPEAGQKFGPYEILGRLGGGGMGLVLRAWDDRLHREVAIKLLHDDYTMPGMRERFLQEARAASALNHPNICTVFDIGEQDHNPYLVMELLEGETVKDRISRGAPSAEEIVRYAIEISDALAVAHAKGIVHRDIKPANIFLVTMPNGKSQAKVLDFGLAKIELEVRGGLESRRLDLTLEGSTVGTLSYMSPEQARGESLDLRSDLFSLGVVLYEMATRQLPFKGTTSALMFMQLFNHTPEPVEHWNESIPRDLEKVILKLLAKERKARFQTAQELHDALVKVSSKLGRGGWLGKASPPVVPLVRANDPVAWHKGPKRKSEPWRGETPTGVMSPIKDSTSGFGNILIRPLRVADQDRGGLQLSSKHSVAGSALAVESGEMTGEPLADQVRVKELDDFAVATVQRREDNSLVWRREPILTESKSALMRLENNLDEIAPVASEEEDSAGQELIAASLAVDEKTRVRMVIVAVLIVIGVAVAAVLQSGIFRPLVLGPSDQLLLTVIQNKTEDKSLDGTVMQGLEITLGQSRSLNLLGGEAYRAGRRQVEAQGGSSKEAVSEQRVAQRVGAKAYLYGEITRSGTSYLINVDVLKTDSNDKVATLEETAASRERIPAAISRIAQDIRAEVSEDSTSDPKSNLPLKVGATANINALHAYAVGEMARESGRTSDALAAYQQAATLDPKFVQAQMRLAWLYQTEKAEVASANAAERAQSASSNVSEKVKLLAQFCYEMNASGDYGEAAKTIREFIARYPLDVDGIKGMALVLRMRGKLPEALQAAERGYKDHPFNAEIYEEGELALIETGRYDDALRVEAQAVRFGVLPRRYALIANHLAGKEDSTATEAITMQMAFAGTMTATNGAPVGYAELYRYGLYLDSIGKVGAGAELWRVAGAIAGTVPELASTQTSMLAQGALDRALGENCTTALEMVDDVKNLQKGPVATFNAGMAAAICGDQTYAEKTIAGLRQSYPQNTAVAQYYVPQLQAAAKIGVNEPEKALDSLVGLESYDEISLAPYLRGMANMALGQMPAAILDFRTVQEHRGSSLLVSGNIYPMAELGAARAYAASRDKATSGEAYRRFLLLWNAADRRDPLMVEALAKSK